jgi:hypothetical protein
MPEGQPRACPTRETMPSVFYPFVTRFEALSRPKGGRHPMARGLAMRRKFRPEKWLAYGGTQIFRWS